ncbi:MAG: enolase C-terminal domain-like protein [Aquihabitans sp.]
MTDLDEIAGVIEAELCRVQLPLLHPLRSAHGVELVRDLVLVRLGFADGTEGWGECSALARPTYTSEYTAGAFAMLRDQLVPAVFAGEGGELVGHPMARSALVTAYLDATLRGRGQRLVDHLGSMHGRPAVRVPVAAVVSRNADLDLVLAAVAGHVDSGTALVKMKVSPLPADLEAVRAVRSTWPSLAVAVDGNGTLDQRSLSMLDEIGLVYVEQPAPADALLESAKFAKRLSCPVALDESITSVATLELALSIGAGSIINVKPARLGGPHEAAEVARVAADAGCGVFVGGMLETGLGRATALAVAALPSCNLPTDLGPSSRYVAVDLTDPIELDGEGLLPVPLGPGIGVAPHQDRLADVTIERVLLTR